MPTYEAHPNPKSKQKYVISTTDDGFVLAIMARDYPVSFENHDTIAGAKAAAAKMAKKNELDWTELGQAPGILSKLSSAVDSVIDKVASAYNFDEVEDDDPPSGPIDLTVHVPDGFALKNEQKGISWNYEGPSRAVFSITIADDPMTKSIMPQQIMASAKIPVPGPRPMVGPLELPNGSGVESYRLAQSKKDFTQWMAFLTIDGIGVMINLMCKGDIDRDEWLDVFASIRLRPFDDVEIAALGKRSHGANQGEWGAGERPAEDSGPIDFAAPQVFSFEMSFECKTCLLADASLTTDLCFDVEDLGEDRLVYASPNGVIVATLSEFDVPVTFEFRPDAPPDDLAAWDHVVDTSLTITTGALEVAVMEPYTQWQAPNGDYRVRVCYGNLANAGDDDELDAEPRPAAERDHYRIFIWPGAAIETTVLKQWAGFNV